MQYETCRHIKEDGTYCGSPALQHRKYCHHHLIFRGRRLRRARALRDNLPYRLEIPPLEDLASVQVALSEIVQALGSGQLHHRAAGKMLYAIQQTTSVIKVRAQLEAQLETARAAQAQASAPDGPPLPSVGNCGDQLNPPHGNLSRVQDYPGFEQEFDLKPGDDLDAETDWTLRKADEQIELRQANEFPPLPPGMRPGSAQFRVYREEAYQALNFQLNSLKRELRDYHEIKRQEIEKMKQEALAGYPVAAPPSCPIPPSPGGLEVSSTDAKQPVASQHLPHVGNRHKRPARGPKDEAAPHRKNEVTYEELRGVAESLLQNLGDREENQKKKKAPAAVPSNLDRLTGSA